MKKKYENHELKQLEKDFKEYLRKNPDASLFFKVKVESNPHGQGGAEELWFGVDDDGELSSCFLNQKKIDGVDYSWRTSWTNGTYKGSIEVLGLADFKPLPRAGSYSKLSQLRYLALRILNLLRNEN